MINPSGYWFRNILTVFFLSILVGTLSLEPQARAALIFLDDFEGDGLNAVITNVVRTPTVGPAGSAGWVNPHGAPLVRVTTGPAGQEALVDVPQGSSLDYLGRLGGDFGNGIFFISWDMLVDRVNGGWGLFLIRFPRSDDPTRQDMQVLFGFLDDGRLIGFSAEPLIDHMVTFGTFQSSMRYAVAFVYDLVSHRYSVSLNGIRVVDRQPIPGYLAVDFIDKFGFDINQLMPLPDHPPQGNTYHVDNIRFVRFDPTTSIRLPMILKNF
ncbi:MAG: hypothetical protein HY892_05835 [Deltaproteobacteria bacterium]|nr:hypothetical protein [Deltaproteobacteria bacterium]